MDFIRGRRWFVLEGGRVGFMAREFYLNPTPPGAFENTARRHKRRIWAFVRKSGRGMTAEVLMATPCTKSLGCESGGHKHGGDEGRRLRWKCAAVSFVVRKSGRGMTAEVDSERNDRFYSSTRTVI